MIRIFRLWIIFILLVIFLAVFCGCSSNNRTDDNGDNENVPFSYHYRGFTPIAEQSQISDFENILGYIIISTENEWVEFSQKYCPYAGFIDCPDFSKECLIVECSTHGAKPTASVLSVIENIKIEDKKIIVTLGKETNNNIYAINMDGVTHLAVNIIKVNKDYLPIDVEGINTN